MRTADKPGRRWSAPQTLVTSAAITGGIYAPYIHPWSTARDLYFTLSLWSNYSVMLVATRCRSRRAPSNPVSFFGQHWDTRLHCWRTRT